MFWLRENMMLLRKIGAQASSIAAPWLLLCALASQPALALSEHNVPKIVEVGADRGPVAVEQEQNLTIILKLHNQAAFDKVVENLYDPKSPSYHEWLSEADLDQYAPTAAEFATVQNELVKQGFSVVSSDPGRFSIRVHGSVGTIQKAFQTELHTFSFQGSTVQAHVRDAQLAGEAGGAGRLRRRT